MQQNKKVSPSIKILSFDDPNLKSKVIIKGLKIVVIAFILIGYLEVSPEYRRDSVEIKLSKVGFINSVRTAIGINAKTNHPVSIEPKPKRVKLPTSKEKTTIFVDECF